MLPLIGAAVATQLELAARLHFALASAPATNSPPIECVTTMVSAIVESWLAGFAASKWSQTFCC